MTGRVVAFDLDMTLVDSRPGIHAAYSLLREATGRPIDVETIVASLGPPAQTALAPWFSPEEMDEVLATFRRFMREVGVNQALPLAGAREALAAVRASGDRSLVVTAKHHPLALLTLQAVGLPVDLVVGDLWAEDKASAITAHHAVAYVGDHDADVRAARVAGVPSVAVPSGPISADALRAAGADVVLDSLLEFPAWWAQQP